MLKRLMVVVLIAAFSAAGLRVILSAVNEQGTLFASLGYRASNGRSITVTVAGSADPAAMERAFRTVACENQVNIVRTSVVSRGRGAAIRHYVLQCVRTIFYSSLNIRGRSLSEAETQSGVGYSVSTDRAGGDLQVGSIVSFADQGVLTILPFHQAFVELPPGGTYYVEHLSADGIAGFAQQLRSAFADAGVSGSTVLPADLVFAPNAADTTYAETALVVDQCLMALLCVLMIYLRAAWGRTDAILSMHGHSRISRWWGNFGRAVLPSSLLASLLWLGILVLVPGWTMRVMAEMVSSLAVLVVGIVGLSILLVVVMGGAWPRLLKSGAASGLVSRVNSLLRLVVVTLFVSYTSLAVMVGVAGYAELQGLNSWVRSNEYGTFYPVKVGNDLAEISSGDRNTMAALAFDLYPKLNALGALYIDSNAFEPAVARPHETGSVEPSSATRRLVVNPNYLNVFEVKDLGGRPIRIDDSESRIVVIVPQSRLGEANVVTDQIAREHAIWADSQMRIYGRSTQVSATRPLVVVASPGQSVFSFDPAVNPTEGNLIPDPIIEVTTLGNSPELYRQFAGGGSADPLKVKLVEPGGGARTLESLQPALKSLHLDDNLTSLVTLDDYRGLRLVTLTSTMQQALFELVFLVLLLVIVVVQGMAAVFEQNARPATIMKMFGLPIVVRYKKFFIEEAGILILAFVGAMVMRAMRVGPFSDSLLLRVPSVGLVVVLAGVAAITEAAAAALSLASIERRRFSDVVKGEYT